MKDAEKTVNYKTHREQCAKYKQTFSQYLYLINRKAWWKQINLHKKKKEVLWLTWSEETFWQRLFTILHDIGKFAQRVNHPEMDKLYWFTFMNALQKVKVCMSTQASSINWQKQFSTPSIC